MSRTVVGEIENYPVVYIEERDTVFCKNTAVSFPLIKTIVLSNSSRNIIENKNLTIIKDGNGDVDINEDLIVSNESFIVKLGCLTTTMDNLTEIIRNINKIKRKNKKDEK